MSPECKQKESLLSPPPCPLCEGIPEFFLKFREKDYYRCLNCRGIYMDPDHIVSPEAEKRRYEQHNNDVNDPGYRKFVTPMVEMVQKNFTKRDQGLDFGCGPGPVITEILQSSGYNIAKYDPFFYDYREALSEKYTYIVCCEVIEHFKNPQKEFRMLKSILKPEGVLYCMTEHLEDDTDFYRWHYKNDYTHLFFYHRKCYKWIQDNCGFKDHSINGRIVSFHT